MTTDPRMNGQPNTTASSSAIAERPPAVDLPRDLDFERAWTLQAADSVGVGAERLIAFADARAGSAPIRDAHNRNFAREVVEELADARIYLVWLARLITEADEPDDELSGQTIEAIGLSLQSTIVAFDHAEQARALLAELKAARA